MACERTWAIIFVFLISLSSVAILLFISAANYQHATSKVWTGAMMAALALTLAAGSLSIGSLTRIVTREGTRPMATGFP
jgi:hypothetical protein